jgi:hypothetical protein
MYHNILIVMGSISSRAISMLPSFTSFDAVITFILLVIPVIPMRLMTALCSVFLVVPVEFAV